MLLEDILRLVAKHTYKEYPKELAENDHSFKDSPKMKVEMIDVLNDKDFRVDYNEIDYVEELVDSKDTKISELEDHIKNLELKISELN